MHPPDRPQARRRPCITIVQCLVNSDCQGRSTFERRRVAATRSQPGAGRYAIASDRAGIAPGSIKGFKYLRPKLLQSRFFVASGKHGTAGTPEIVAPLPISWTGLQEILRPLLTSEPHRRRPRDIAAQANSGRNGTGPGLAPPARVFRPYAARPSSRLRRADQAPIRRSAMIPIKAMLSPASTLRPVSAPGRAL